MTLLALLLVPTVGMWWLWVSGGDGQRFYKSMGWTAWWIVGRDR